MQYEHTPQCLANGGSCHLRGGLMQHPHTDGSLREKRHISSTIQHSNGVMMQQHFPAGNQISHNLHAKMMVPPCVQALHQSQHASPMIN